MPGIPNAGDLNIVKLIINTVAPNLLRLILIDHVISQSLTDVFPNVGSSNGEADRVPVSAGPIK